MIGFEKLDQVQTSIWHGREGKRWPQHDESIFFKPLLFMRWKCIRAMKWDGGSTLSGSPTHLLLDFQVLWVVLLEENEAVVVLCLFSWSVSFFLFCSQTLVSVASSNYQTKVNLGSDLWVRNPDVTHSVSQWCFIDFIDHIVTKVTGDSIAWVHGVPGNAKFHFLENLSLLAEESNISKGGEFRGSWAGYDE